MRMALEFAKTGAAKYISHLDLQRAFSRAIRRSGLPVKLSEGFNPHYVVSFASALSLGMESDCECVEMALAQQVSAEEFLLNIARALPPGLVAKQAVRLRDSAPKLMAALSEADYEMPIDLSRVDDLKRSVEDVLKQEEILAVKVSGGKEKQIDIRPMIKALTVYNDRLVMRLSAAQTGSLKPDMLLDVIEKQTDKLERRVKRTALYTQIGSETVDLLDAFSM
jgi:radical SAM-linked protein